MINSDLRGGRIYRLLEMPTRNQVRDDEVPPPSLDEIGSAIKQLKSCAGSDGLAAELFKMGPEWLTVEMHQLIVKVLEQEKLPEKCKLGVIQPVYKKRNRLVCTSFPAITVLNAAYKILSQILFCRLAPLAANFGWQLPSWILQKCRECQIPTHYLFIDFKAAYDTIDRKELWSIMQRYHFPGKFIRLLEATVNGVQCKHYRNASTSTDSEADVPVEPLNLINLAAQANRCRADLSLKGGIAAFVA
uniref:uncharacterized protein LOC125907350 n=1 Tax=Anopheles coluzzii TaxID=1518534 RepID=UPI0020FFAFA3|nr:uncharacterized protein LOC125907350 [Anopheles coluzzii]